MWKNGKKKTKKPVVKKKGKDKSTEKSKEDKGGKAAGDKDHEIDGPALAQKIQDLFVAAKRGQFFSDTEALWPVSIYLEVKRADKNKHKDWIGEVRIWLDTLPSRDFAEEDDRAQILQGCYDLLGLQLDKPEYVDSDNNPSLAKEWITSSKQAAEKDKKIVSVAIDKSKKKEEKAVSETVAGFDGDRLANEIYEVFVTERRAHHLRSTTVKEIVKLALKAPHTGEKHKKWREEVRSLLETVKRTDLKVRTNRPAIIEMVTRVQTSCPIEDDIITDMNKVSEQTAREWRDKSRKSVQSDATPEAGTATTVEKKDSSMDGDGGGPSSESGDPASPPTSSTAKQSGESTDKSSQSSGAAGSLPKPQKKKKKRTRRA